MEEFLISTTLTSDLIKRYTDSIWKIVSKKFKRVKIFRIYVSILILLSWLVLGYDFYCYTVYAKTHSSLFSIVLLCNYYDCSCSVPYKLQVYCIEKTPENIKEEYRVSDRILF